ncbi:MAG: carbon-nitrogen hydrolase family protein [candidate division Zixibacteria bacterium]|nr:carbon-nitrogen hydrolase family protein [candidate division Zixibacteria bacterium]
MLVKIIGLQRSAGARLSLDEKIYLFKQRPDFVCLPEYHFIESDTHDYHRAALYSHSHLEYILQLSEELETCIIGGTIVEAEADALYNTSYIFDRGQLIGRYRKRHPMEREQARGIRAGSDNFVFVIDGVKIGLMICGDVFFPERYDELGAMEADIIFIPTSSPYRPDDSLSQKNDRDKKYFLDGANRAGAFVCKVCGIGSIFGMPRQGRSLVAAPWGLLERVEIRAEQQPRMLTATLDIDELREFRRKRGKQNSLKEHASDTA